MASITKEPNGRRTIQFVACDGKRKSVRLGKISQRNAEAIKVKVERLAATALSEHAADDDTIRWVTSLDDVLHEKLAKVGLVEGRTVSTVLAFVDDYITNRSDVKRSTATVWKRARKHIAAFFGDRNLRDVNIGHAKDFRRYLQGKLAEDTVRRTCGIAKQFFEDAIDRRLISQNPFKHRDIPTATGGGDKSREFFVTRELAARVLQALPTAQWRAMFALARYGGLRCPSEVLSLRWNDIDWDRERITVTSPKTEHHEDGASREIPLWPELRPYLEECFELANVGAEFVITDYRKMDSSYGTLLTKKLKSAKITPWPKPWQNLRSTCETELVETFPIQVVCAWLGNSPTVAQKHYLQVTDEHFAKAVQNPVQQMHETRRDDSQRVSCDDSKVSVLREFATTSDCLQTLPMGDEGLEPPTPSV